MTLPYKRILYLDFDGVLHPADVWFVPEAGFFISEGYEEHELFEHAELLVRMLAPHKDVGIVLSTSWVRGLGLARAAARLPASLRQRVVGATFDPLRHGRQFGAVARGYQVLEHVKEARPTDWVALDDDGDGWPEQERHRLILTDKESGLGDPDAQALLKNWLSQGCAG